MIRAGRFWILRAGEVVAAAVLLGALWRPAQPSAPSALALGVGVLAGLLLFATLSHRAPPATRRAVSPPVLALAALVLLVRAAVEEAIWRAGVTGLVASAVGWPVGLTAGTAGFALAHLGAGRAAVAANAGTGLVFGVLFLASGRLTAAFAAHASYNLLVLASRTP